MYAFVQANIKSIEKIIYVQYDEMPIQRILY